MDGLLRTEPGGWTVKVESTEGPPHRGVNAFEISVHDASGTPSDGLALAVTPWMVAHGHGSPESPVIAPGGAGIYHVGNVVFFMAGAWNLRIHLGGSDQNDLTVTYDIP